MESEKVKEIKKGLECCSTLMDNNATSEEQDNSCNECPYRLNDRCSWKLDSDALTLINELESENKELEDEIVESENEKRRLYKALNSIQKGFNNGEFISKDCKIRELKQFSEKLKEKSDFYRNGERIVDMVTFDDIDETLKELKEQV